MSEYKLAEEIVALSESDNWQDAKHEWKLIHICYEDEPDTCLCGHFPIKELCFIKNIKNKNETFVGNCCVKKFLGISTGTMFTSLRKIKNDKDKSPSEDLIRHAHANRWINDWEKKFAIDMLRKRKLTWSQLLKRKEINEIIIRRAIKSSS